MKVTIINSMPGRARKISVCVRIRPGLYEIIIFLCLLLPVALCFIEVKLSTTNADTKPEFGPYILSSLPSS